MSDTTNPYAGPEAASTVLVSRCPRCGSLMDDGDLASSCAIRWRPTSLGAFKAFLSGGETIGESRTGLGFQFPAFYCGHCRLIILKP